MNRFSKNLLLRPIFFCFLFLGFFAFSNAYAGNITSGSAKAKILEDSSVINTGYFTNVASYNVTVSSTELTGMFFSENYGWIRLSCSAIGSLTDTCGNYNYKVLNDGNGNLSGYAWGENIGWVSFSCANSTSSCSGGAGNWGVTINTSNGDFAGYAWSENIGWIKFDCSDPNACTNTSWRPSSGGGGGGGYGGGGGTGSGSGSGSGTGSGSGSSGSGSGTGSGSGSSGSGSSGSGSGSGSGTGSGSGSSGSGSGTGSGSGSSSGGGSNSGGGSSSSGGGGSGIVTNNNSGIFNVDPQCTTAYCGTLRSINTITNTASLNIKKTKTTLKKVEEVPTVREAGAVAATTGAVVGSVSLVSTVLFVNPLSVGELIFIPIRIWTFLMILFGIKKKSKPWGTVYDSITKQPLDPAYVSLIDKDGKEVDSAITDLDGRFGFLLAPGEYTIVANKTNYIFPSRYLLGKTEDEVYKDLYFGGKIIVTEEQYQNQSELVIYNIPMDPTKFDWNEFEKTRTNVMRFYKKSNKWLVKVADVMFYVGFLVAAISYWVNTRDYNLIMVGVYVLMFILRHTFLRPKPRTKIMYANKKPASFAVVHIKRGGKDFIKKVADQNGQIFCLIQNGQYTVDIERKNTDGSYTKLIVDQPINITNGIFAQEFILDEEVQKFADILDADPFGQNTVSYKDDYSGQDVAK